MKHIGWRKGSWKAEEEDGFTYIGLLIAIAILGVALAGTGTLVHTTIQREKETQLLFVGDQYRRAIGVYYSQTPGGAKRYPKSLDELLGDNRYLVPRRYLRKHYRDPITNSGSWGLVRAADGGIAGVFSLSEEKPIKMDNFSVRDKAFKNAIRYADWRFVYTPEEQPSAPKSK